ncbi:hypothetical protein HPULCUR_009700 [Helicostylum pulchrum]|uniref:Kelch repeat protein n=1 Tax=Helicostylum pulchrum TaxID=562976 RepID=A0ABP9YBA0_9FUNG
MQEMMPYRQPNNSNFITETMHINSSSNLSNLSSTGIRCTATLSNDSFQVIDSTSSSNNDKETLKWFFKAVSEADNSSFVKAIIPTPRYNGAVSQRLYCYGGTSNLLPTSDHYVFDLSTDFPIDGSIEAWNKVVTGDFETEPNSLFSIVPLTDKYLIHGGLGYGSSTNFLKNTTTLYNALDGTWRTINSTNQTSMTPSREETSTLDSSNRIWTWGGIRFKRMNMAWSFPDSTKTSYPRARIAHTATLGRSGQSIFYIGGLEVNDSGMLSSVSMGQIHEYHIANNTWTTHQSPSNSTIPSPRRLHTATQSN